MFLLLNDSHGVSTAKLFPWAEETYTKYYCSMAIFAELISQFFINPT